MFPFKFGFLALLILPSAVVLAFERDYFQVGGDGTTGLTESMRSMLEDGFSQHEIINTVKTELGSKRIKAYIEKMYEGEDLTNEELETIKSGEVEETDEELVKVLEEFGNLIDMQNRGRMNISQFHDSSHEFSHEKDIVKELFRENEEDENSTERENTPLIKPNYAYSPFDLIRLVKAEEAIYKPLKKYIKKLETKLELLKR